MADQPTPQPWFTRSTGIALLNVVLAVAVSAMLIGKLKNLNKHNVFAPEEVTTVRDTVTVNDTTGTAAAPKIVQRTIIKALPVQRDTAAQNGLPGSNEKHLVDFIDVIYLMLLAGALGGVLCNLRGIFAYYRDGGELPDDMHVPYFVRPFTGGICGLLVYFVATLLVTSITVIPVAEGIGFQGMVSNIALAIVAGFGSQEFMDRLKALAGTLFGSDKKPPTPGQQLRDWYSLMRRGVITQDQYNGLVNKALGINGESQGSVPDAGLFEVFKSAPTPPAEGEPQEK